MIFFPILFLELRTCPVAIVKQALLAKLSDESSDTYLLDKEHSERLSSALHPDTSFETDLFEVFQTLL